MFVIIQEVTNKLSYDWLSCNTPTVMRTPTGVHTGSVGGAPFHLPSLLLHRER